MGIKITFEGFMLKKNAVGLFILSLITVVTVGAFGAALDNTHMGLKAFSMGKAFTGLADDASAVFYNPAGLIQLKEGISIQAYSLFLSPTLKYEIAGSEYISDEKVFFPGFFLAYKTGKMALGLGVFIPYGGGKVNYPNFVGSGETYEQSLGLIAISGSFSYELSPKFSAGFSVSAYYAMFSFKPPSTIAPVNDDYSGLAGVGGNVGFLFRASKAFSIGLTVKLPVSVSVEGTTTTSLVSTSFDGKAELDLPWYFTLGAALKASDKLTMTLDINYATYAALKTYLITRSGFPSAPLASQEEETKYTDAVYLAIGADFKASKVLSIRGGVTYTPNATLDSGLTPTCDVTHFTFSLGGAYAFSPVFEFGVNIHYLMGEVRTVVTQKYDKDVLMFMTGVNLKF